MKAASASARLGITAAALSGDSGGLYNIVARLMDEGVPLGSLLFDVLLPTERDVGSRWQSGDYLVSEEHTATATLETVVALLAGSLDQPEDGLHVVIASAEGDAHSLAGRAVVAYLLFQRIPDHLPRRERARQRPAGVPRQRATRRDDHLLHDDQPSGRSQGCDQPEPLRRRARARGRASIRRDRGVGDHARSRRLGGAPERDPRRPSDLGAGCKSVRDPGSQPVGRPAEADRTTHLGSRSSTGGSGATSRRHAWPPSARRALPASRRCRSVLVGRRQRDGHRGSEVAKSDPPGPRVRRLGPTDGGPHHRLAAGIPRSRRGASLRTVLSRWAEKSRWCGSRPRSTAPSLSTRPTSTVRPGMPWAVWAKPSSRFSAT